MKRCSLYLREDDTVIRTKTGSEKFWFSKFFSLLKQPADLSNHAKFQSIQTINGRDMAILSFELFYEPEFEKLKKGHLCWRNGPILMKINRELLWAKRKPMPRIFFDFFDKKFQVPMWFSWMCKYQGVLQTFLPFFCQNVKI